MALRSVASAASVDLSHCKVWEITGTAAITNFTGVKDGDERVIYPAAAFTMTSAGNITATTATAVVGRPILFICRDGELYEAVGATVTHGHAMSDVTGLVAALAGKANLAGGNSFTGDQVVSGGGRIGVGGVSVGIEIEAQGSGSTDIRAYDTNAAGSGIANLIVKTSGAGGNEYYMRTGNAANGVTAWQLVDLTAGTIPISVANGTGVVTLHADLPIASGGTGQSTAQAAIDALTNVAAATNEHVLTKDTATGNAIFKAAAGGGGGVPTTIASIGGIECFKQSADVTNATTTPANLTGLSFGYDPNAVYIIDLYMMATSVAATTGYGYCFDVNTAVTYTGLTFSHSLATTGTQSGGDSIADGATRSHSSGVPAITVTNMIQGRGILVTGVAGGTCTLQFRPEVAASATSKANSVMRVQRVS